MFVNFRVSSCLSYFQSDVCIFTFYKTIEEANQEFTDDESSEYDESEGKDDAAPEDGT